MDLLDGVKANATMSLDGRYRYVLTRDWFPKSGEGAVLWIMLNPSTADATQDDPTLRRVQHFSRSWGYDGATVVNLFAYRTSRPAELRSVPDPGPVGPANDDVIETMMEAHGVGLVIAAWGAAPYRTHPGRVSRVRQLAHRARRPLHCLGVTAKGAPIHPLARGRYRVSDDTQPSLWRP